MENIEFTTQYFTRYTKPIQFKRDEFKTDYVIRNIENIISIESRPKNKRFKSRLVEK